jgi:hypothetical protein
MSTIAGVPESSISGIPEAWLPLIEADTSQAPAAMAPGIVAQWMAGLLGIMGYFWWLAVAGPLEILFGGLYLGSAQQADIHLPTAWLQVFYVLFGIALAAMAQGILRLERWTVWVGPLLALGLIGVSIYELVRWITGTPIAVYTGVFSILSILFALIGLYTIYSSRKLAFNGVFESGWFSSDLTMFVAVLVLPALSLTVLVHYVDKHLSTQTSALFYVLTFVLMIVMAFAALKLQTWVWVAAWAWSAALTVLSVDAIYREAFGSGGSVEGLIVGIVCILFAANVVYYLVRADMRKAFLHGLRGEGLFAPRLLFLGLLLGVFALVIYLLPGWFGSLAIAYSVPGLAVGTVVALLPEVNPPTQMFGFLAGMLLAFASYVVRGAFLPYTNWSSALVVLLLFAAIVGITAILRSRAWFVLMLLGAGILYAISELQFRLAPSAYVVSAVTMISILFGFGIGYVATTLLGLEVLTAPQPTAVPSDAAQVAPTGTPPSSGTPPYGTPVTSGPTSDDRAGVRPAVAETRADAPEVGGAQRDDRKEVA